MVLKKLYIRLPKENLYIDSFKYEEYLLNSITNEFLRVISTLKPMSIKIQMFNYHIWFSGHYKVCDIHGGSISAKFCHNKIIVNISLLI